MLTKIALAAALIAGTASVAFAEGDSTVGIYAQTAQQRSVPAFTGRNVRLGRQFVAPAAQGGYDHASSPYAGGGF